MSYDNENNIDTELNINDDELMLLIRKEMNRKEKQKECNKRWRMKNEDKVKAYHKQYNKKKNEMNKMIMKLAKERNLI